MRSDAIVGYSYNADQFCPACVLDALPTGEGEKFDGWRDVSVPPMCAEENLSELAAAFGIDRDDEASFDSGDFPKVILAVQVESADETCGGCGEPLID